MTEHAQHARLNIACCDHATCIWEGEYSLDARIKYQAVMPCMYVLSWLILW